MWKPCTKCEKYNAFWRQKEFHTPTTPCPDFSEYDPTNYQQWGICREQNHSRH